MTNEWEFTAEVAGWINDILARQPRFPFACARCEQTGHGNRKRRDLTLLDKDERIVLTGEVKLPYQPEGFSPYGEALVEDTRRKAQRAGAAFFFTWNVNELVLWQSFPPRTPHKDRHYTSWRVTNVVREEHLDQPMTEHAIKQWLSQFLAEFANILHGAQSIGLQSPDEKFIQALESALQMPIHFTIEELHTRYKQRAFKAELDKWMREEQGWTIYDDEEGIRENLDRAAKFSCYAFVNRLVFYEALLKRYAAAMTKVTVPDHIRTGEELRLLVARHFEDAKQATKDYETVFGEDHAEMGNRIPFYSDHAVPHWRELINQVHHFDFSKLDYEVIGRIFERLISPEERHRFGQFYTSAEVVDLVNAFSIRSADARVMDPACGGGTFLVRAYARKRELNPAQSHGKLLSEIYGVDISHFATHLTTINLATRDLIDEENYPQITRGDFFDIAPEQTILSLPALGGKGHRIVKVPALDAVVGNPPYVRQEDIPRAKKARKSGPPQPGSREFYASVLKAEWPCIDLSGRSDLHCYFWPHAAKFLKDDGYLCLLTSSQWLDVEYGFGLQKWILENFEAKAIFESIEEPWFVGARVATAVTILRRQKDDAARMANVVRFVQLRRPLKEILAHDGTAAGALAAADRFRDEILALQANTVNERYRARLIHQSKLWDDGVKLGKVMKKAGGGYYGSKWGVYLRAPDLWFELIDLCAERLAPVAEVADVARGVTSGKDCFFFPRDHSAEALKQHPEPGDFEQAYGVPRRAVASGNVRLVRCGEGYAEVRAIEAEYLEPEVHSLMEVDSFTVSARDCTRQILLVNRPKKDLTGSYVLVYIEWGEERGYHTGATCAARVTEGREWYDLTGHRKGALFWPMSQQYKHIVPENRPHLICNHNLFDVFVPPRTTALHAGNLNSSWTVLSKYQYGRPVGVEGNLKTEVVDVNMMLVPDPKTAGSPNRRRVAAAFRKMGKRKALYFLSERRLRTMAYKLAGKESELETLSDLCELDMPDRRELDDAVLQMMGIKQEALRTKLIDELYAYLREFFELTRQKEERAIANKKAAKRRGPAPPGEVAAQILEEIRTQEPELLRRYDPDFVSREKPHDTFDLPSNGKAAEHSDMFTPHSVRFANGKKALQTIEAMSPVQARLLSVVANSGVRGLVRTPHEAAECKKVLADYEAFLARREARLRARIEERTADEDTQEKILAALLQLLTNARSAR